MSESKSVGRRYWWRGRDKPTWLIVLAALALALPESLRFDLATWWVREGYQRIGVDWERVREFFLWLMARGLAWLALTWVFWLIVGLGFLWLFRALRQHFFVSIYIGAILSIGFLVLMALSRGDVVLAAVALVPLAIGLGADGVEKRLSTLEAQLLESRSSDWTAPSGRQNA